MSLKQDIVVKNEFTHNGVNTPGKGSRGGSPGQYVLRYMARVEATETVTPVPDSPDSSIFDYTTRYMLREDATEQLKTSGQADASLYELEHKFEELDQLTGRSFGNRGITLSDSVVRESSERIQQAFDEGHSVQKIILSFTEEYLKENKILSPNYEHQGRGSYRGQIDQLKLRQAITNGVDKMTKVGNYANPEWVGVIQVDTNHVHAHLALVDTEFSPSRMMKGGGDKGKLTQREMMNLRRGIQYELNDMKAIKGFYKQVSVERQNVVGFVKDYAYNHIDKNSRIQLLVAALPEEQHYWRYGTNRKEMKYANELAEQVVDKIFEEQPVRSGYNDAIRSIDQYIKGRVETEGLDFDEQDRLKRNGRKLLVERSINGVYESLKAFDKKSLNVRTPMIDIQSSSDDELLESLSDPDEFDRVGFELRVRGYSKRRDHHTEQSVQYKKLMDVFDDANEQGQVSPDAIILRRFYEEELEWHMALTDKYRSFFRINGRADRENVEKHYPKYERLYERFEDIRLKDDFLKAVDDDSIFDELHGINSKEDVFTQSSEVNNKIAKTYGVTQGSRAFSELYKDGLKREIQNDKADYMKELKEYTFDCFVDGVATQKEWVKLQTEHRNILDEDYLVNVSRSDQYFTEPIPPQTREEGITQDHFDQIKALDIHHLEVDFYAQQNRDISDKNRQRFIDAMQWREYFLEHTEMFLEATGQVTQLRGLHDVQSDVSDMRRTVDYMSETGSIPTIDPITDTDRSARNSYTIRVDTGVDVLSSMERHLILTEEELNSRLTEDAEQMLEVNDLE